MKKKQRKKGFTLIELIVVIAILGILSTLATPAFTGLRENSEERVCNANISTAVRSILAYSVFEETDINDDIVAIAMAELGAINNGTSFTGLCPTDGHYVYNPDNNTVACTIHGNAAEVTADFSDLAVNIMATSKLAEYFKNTSASRDYLDSSGPNFGGVIKNDLLTNLGISSDDYDFRIARNKDGTYYIYISDSLANMPPGDPVSVTAYVYSTATKSIIATGPKQTVATKASTTVSTSGAVVTHTILVTEGANGYIWG